MHVLLSSINRNAILAWNAQTTKRGKRIPYYSRLGLTSYDTISCPIPITYYVKKSNRDNCFCSASLSKPRLHFYSPHPPKHQINSFLPQARAWLKVLSNSRWHFLFVKLTRPTLSSSSYLLNAIERQRERGIKNYVHPLQKEFIQTLLFCSLLIKSTSLIVRVSLMLIILMIC
jgi:hypothetical protein